MEHRRWHDRYDPGVPAGVGFTVHSLPELLRRTSRAHPGRTALVFLNARMSYARLQEEVDRLATALTALGVGVDDRVAVHLPNMPQTVISYLAVVSCGAQVVMTNPLYTPPEIRHQWTDAGVTVAITADFLFAGPLADVRDELGVRHWIVAGLAEYLAFPLRWLAPIKLRRAHPPKTASFTEGPRVHAFRKLIRRTRPDPPSPTIGPGHLAALQYTGGTTGVSKGAMLSHGNLTSNVQQVRAWLPDLVPGEEVFLAALPYFHIFGLTICMSLPLFIGATIVIAPDPRDMGSIVGWIERHRISVLPVVPAMIDVISARHDIERRDLSSVRAVFSGSAPLAEDSMRRFESLTGAVVFEGYGLTETSPVTHVNPLKGERRVGSVGLPVPDTDARVVDPDDPSVERPVGEPGELIIAGPQVMQGYWGRPDETARTMWGEWLLTGDLATMDAEGYFRIVGRKKDMILASGYNIYPDEIDRVLLDHPDVSEACTIGVPDRKRGETVKSFIVRRPGSTVEADDLKHHCRERLAAYKVPRSFAFRDELPKSAMMKLLRRTLRDEELARIEAEAG